MSLKKEILPDGSVEYYGGGDVLGYNFIAFIQEYRLHALLAIFIIFSYFWRYHHVDIQRKTHP